MKKLSKTIIAVGACQIATSCASLPEVAHERDDAVAIALANGGCIDAASLKWTREPAGFSVQNGAISIKTAPRTDLWQRTYYHFRNDNAPALQMSTWEKSVFTTKLKYFSPVLICRAGALSLRKW